MFNLLLVYLNIEITGFQVLFRNIRDVYELWSQAGLLDVLMTALYRSEQY